MRIKPYYWYLFLIFWSLQVRAELHVPDILSDHMVLQRGVPIPIWGYAEPGEMVTVTFGEHTSSVNTSNEGKWEVLLIEMAAGGPYQLEIVCEHSLLVLKDIMVGEVWLCSGQSNMEWPLIKADSGEDAVKEAVNTQLRFFLMQKKYSLDKTPFPKETITEINEGRFYQEASWQPCTPQTAANFSAVGYYFAKRLYDSLQVPIGLIQNAVGGSPIQSWVSHDGLQSHPQLRYLTDSTRGNTWHYQPGLHPWVIERALENLQLWFRESSPGRIPRHPFGPSYLFDFGLRPLNSYPIKGLLWYQGESDATNPDLYIPMFQQLVKDIRWIWNREDLPVIFVQLPRIGNRNRWPEFREVQRQALSINNTVMVVSIDTGHPTDVHPREKKVIGERMAMAALGKWYHMKVPYLGPVLESWTLNKHQLHLEFSHVGDSLIVAGKTLGNLTLEGYHENGTEQLFLRPTRVEVTGKEVIVDIPAGLSLTTVKYAWLPYPNQPLLYNNHNLPASPFKLELPGNN